MSEEHISFKNIHFPSYNIDKFIRYINICLDNNGEICDNVRNKIISKVNDLISQQYNISFSINSEYFIITKQSSMSIDFINLKTGDNTEHTLIIHV